MLNKVFEIGRLTADPELRNTKDGTPVCDFRIAVPRKFSKKDECDFLTVVAWRGAAEFVSKYFTKGKLILVEGCLQTKEWTDKEGVKRRDVVIMAEQVSFVGPKPKDDGSLSEAAPAAPEGFDPFAAMQPTEDLPF